MMTIRQIAFGPHVAAAAALAGVHQRRRLSGRPALARGAGVEGPGSIRTDRLSTFRAAPSQTVATDTNQMLADGNYINDWRHLVQINITSLVRQTQFSFNCSLISTISQLHSSPPAV